MVLGSSDFLVEMFSQNYSQRPQKGKEGRKGTEREQGGIGPPHTEREGSIKNRKRGKITAVDGVQGLLREEAEKKNAVW